MDVPVLFVGMVSIHLIDDLKENHEYVVLLKFIDFLDTYWLYHTFMHQSILV